MGVWVEEDCSSGIYIVLEGYIYKTTHKDFIACSTIDELLSAIALDLGEIEKVKEGK